MQKEEYKQIMYLNYEGFTKIMWILEAEIVNLWTNGMLESAYERIKQLFIHVNAHLKNKKAKDLFMPKFKEIEDIIYNPINKKFTTLSKYKKERNRKEADKLMFDLYIGLKENMKESGLEAFYGVPQQTLIDIKKEKNIKNVFGKDMYE